MTRIIKNQKIKGFKSKKELIDALKISKHRGFYITPNCFKGISNDGIVNYGNVKIIRKE